MISVCVSLDALLSDYVGQWEWRCSKPLGSMLNTDGNFHELFYSATSLRVMTEHVKRVVLATLAHQESSKQMV